MWPTAAFAYSFTMPSFTLAEVPDFAGWGGEEGKGGEAPGKIAEYPRA